MLSRLAIEVSKYGMCTAAPKYKILYQDCQDLAHKLIFFGGELKVVDNIKYFRSLITTIGVVKEVGHITNSENRNTFRESATSMAPQ